MAGWWCCHSAIHQPSIANYTARSFLLKHAKSFSLFLSDLNGRPSLLLTIRAQFIRYRYLVPSSSSIESSYSNQCLQPTQSSLCLFPSRHRNSPSLSLQIKLRRHTLPSVQLPRENSIMGTPHPSVLIMVRKSGHLFLIIASPAEYLTVSGGIPFLPPVNPPVDP